MQIICFKGISCGSVFVTAAGRILGGKSPQKDDLTGEFSAIHPEKLLHSLSPSFLQSFMSLSLHSFSTLAITVILALLDLSCVPVCQTVCLSLSVIESLVLSFGDGLN